MTISKKLLIVGTLALGMQYCLPAYHIVQIIPPTPPVAPRIYNPDRMIKILNFIDILQQQKNNPQAQEVAQWLKSTSDEEPFTQYDSLRFTRIIDKDSTIEEKIAFFMSIKKADMSIKKAEKIQSIKNIAVVAAIVGTILLFPKLEQLYKKWRY